jgi:hypothetical protein
MGTNRQFAAFMRAEHVCDNCDSVLAHDAPQLLGIKRAAAERDGHVRKLGFVQEWRRSERSVFIRGLAWRSVAVGPGQ